MNEITNEAVRLPLWQGALDAMRVEGLTYGKQWKADYFEQHLRTTRDQPAFSFAMLALKDCIEKEDGYYLAQSESGAVWEIPTAVGHEETCVHFDRKVRRYAVRSIALRSATLMNPAAELTEEERRRMESNLEKAAVRLVLMSRQQTIVGVLQKHSPKLLEKKNTPALESDNGNSEGS